MVKFKKYIFEPTKEVVDIIINNKGRTFNKKTTKYYDYYNYICPKCGTSGRISIKKLGFFKSCKVCKTILNTKLKK